MFHGNYQFFSEMDFVWCCFLFHFLLGLRYVFKSIFGMCKPKMPYAWNPGFNVTYPPFQKQLRCLQQDLLKCHRNRSSGLKIHVKHNSLNTKLFRFEGATSASHHQDSPWSPFSLCKGQACGIPGPDLACVVKSLSSHNQSMVVLLSTTFGSFKWFCWRFSVAFSIDAISLHANSDVLLHR